MSLLIFFFVLSIAFSFLCSILEAVLLSVTPSYVTQQLQAGTRTGILLDKFKKDIDRPLSAILTLNTVAHTAGAIGVGAQAGKMFAGAQGIFGINMESLIAGAMTLAILILSEIIPKTLGANNWRLLAPAGMRIIRFLIWILFPLVWLSQFITRSMKRDKEMSVLSRADYAALTRVGEKSGAINKEESQIIKNLLNFEKLKVRNIMTPRTVAFMVKESMTVDEFMNQPQADTFSRVPIYKEDKDHVTGMVLKNEIMKVLVNGEGGNKKLRDLKVEINFVSDQLPLPDLFSMLTREKRHLFAVTDEFGSIVGLVTMEDMFETLLGVEIVDESDKVIDLQKYAREKYQEKIPDTNNEEDE